jgi:hypothetical protein
MAFELVRRWGPWLALAALALLILLAGPASCRKQARLAAEARAAAEQRTAGAASGRDAVATAGAAAARERASDELAQANHKEIDDADGADVAVGGDVTRAGLDGLCRRAAYRDSERCRVRGADPRRVEGWRAGGAIAR